MFIGREWEYVKSCLDGGWVSSAGPLIGEFERRITTRCKVDFAIATVNGTSGLHVALLAAGVMPGDLVVCPAITFVATANAISYCGATPLFCDCEGETLGLDPIALDRLIEERCERHDGVLRLSGDGRIVRACVPVHVFGHPARIEEIVSICRTAHVIVVEDATESLGSTYRGRACGTVGDAGVLSFNGNKIMTAGGGGMVITNDRKLAERVRYLSTTARDAQGFGFFHGAVGYNYRLPNLNAALGCAQFEQLDRFVTAKRRLAEAYARLFGDCQEVSLLREPTDATSNFWLNALLFETHDLRERFLTETNACGIETRPCWNLLADLPIYLAAPTGSDLSRTRDLASRVANIPSSAWLADKLAI